MLVHGESVVRVVGPELKRERCNAWHSKGLPRTLSNCPTMNATVRLSSGAFIISIGQNKPSLFQPCQTRACPRTSQDESNDIRDSDVQSDSNGNPDTSTSNYRGTRGSYRWDYGEWGSCSASCLGGKRPNFFDRLFFKGNKSLRWSVSTWTEKSRSPGLIVMQNNVRSIYRDRATTILAHLHGRYVFHALLLCIFRLGQWANVRTLVAVGFEREKWGAHGKFLVPVAPNRVR